MRWKKYNFWWIFLRLSFLSFIPLLFFSLLFPSLFHSFSSLSFHLCSPCFSLPSTSPHSFQFVYFSFFPSSFPKPSTFLSITSLFSMFFFPFLHSLAYSLIFLLTLYIFPTHIHRPNHSKVKGMVTVLWGSKGMER